MYNTQKIIIPIPVPIPVKQPKLVKQQLPYSEFKSDGKPKPQAADSIRSYDDFVAIQNYFLNKGQMRNWMMWVIGVNFGLRISDLSQLKFHHLLNPDNTFRERLKIIEQKTSKLNDILITEAVKSAVSQYLDSLDWQFELNGYLFASRKTKKNICTRSGWRILSEASEALGLPINVGSHTMRKSFLNISASTNKSKIDMNAIATMQYLCNHADQRVTMKYLSIFEQVSDKARIAVSDFTLGKSAVNELIPITYEDKHSLLDVVVLLEELKTKLSN